MSIKSSKIVEFIKNNKFHIIYNGIILGEFIAIHYFHDKTIQELEQEKTDIRISLISEKMEHVETLIRLEGLKEKLKVIENRKIDLSEYEYIDVWYKYKTMFNDYIKNLVLVAEKENTSLDYESIIKDYETKEEEYEGKIQKIKQEQLNYENNTENMNEYENKAEILRCKIQILEYEYRIHKNNELKEIVKQKENEYIKQKEKQ
jgi:hypothetical protein